MREQNTIKGAGWSQSTLPAESRGRIRTFCLFCEGEDAESGKYKREQKQGL